MAFGIADLVGQVVAEDPGHNVLDDPRFFATLNLGYNKIHTPELANVSTRPAMVLVEYETDDLNHQPSFA